MTRPSTIDLPPDLLARRPLTEGQAAAYLSLSPATLRDRRSLGLPPTFRKAGSAVRYRVADLDAFLDGAGAE